MSSPEQYPVATQPEFSPVVYQEYTSPQTPDGLIKYILDIASKADQIQLRKDLEEATEK